MYYFEKSSIFGYSLSIMYKNIIYGLVCPFTEQIRYVGQSTVGLYRPLTHLRKSHSTKVNEWVNELKEIGFEPKIILLEECENEQLLNDKERFWIYKILKEKGMLLNVSFVTAAMLFANHTMPEANNGDLVNIRTFIKKSRRELKLTQEKLAKKAKVGLRFIRDLEQGKMTVRLDKVMDCLNELDGQIVVRKIAHKINTNLTENS